MQDSNLTCRRIGEAGCIVASLIKVHANGLIHGLADLKLLFPVGSHSLNWFLEEHTEYHKSNRKSVKRGIASYIRAMLRESMHNEFHNPSSARRPIGGRCRFQHRHEYVCCGPVRIKHEEGFVIWQHAAEQFVSSFAF